MGVGVIGVGTGVADPVGVGDGEEYGTTKGSIQSTLYTGVPDHQLQNGDCELWHHELPSAAIVSWLHDCQHLVGLGLIKGVVFDPEGVQQG